MHIFIDVSGSFSLHSAPGSWCLVGAYVITERSRRKAESVLAKLKAVLARPASEEIKLKDVDERAYLRFLESLGELQGLLLATAADPGAHSPEAIATHQKNQVGGVLKNKTRLRYAEAASSLQDAADRLASLSPQLYLQLICQFDLVFQTIDQSTLYFSQRHPPALANFRWRINQKNEGVSAFEQSLRVRNRPAYGSASSQETFGASHLA